MTAGSPEPASSRSPASAHSWQRVIREVAADRVARRVFTLTALLVGFAYSLVLPFDYTQRISFANWSYLNLRYVAFSVAFALGMAWLLALQVHAVRRVAASAIDGAREAGRAGPVAVLAALLSVLPSLLCCSPILPTLVGLIGLSATTRLTTTGHLQYFFATQQNLLMAGALALLVLSGLWSTRKLARAACLQQQSCRPSPALGSGATGQHAAPYNPNAPSRTGMRHG